MANSDPIATVVQALSVLVAPNPALSTPNTLPPTTWTDGTKVATDGTLYTPVQTLLGVLFGASTDLTSLGNGVNTALTDVAKVTAKIADQLGSLQSVEQDATNALSALQTVLSLAQALAPSSGSSVLQSAGGLFQQLQNLLSIAGSIEQAAAELAELSQQLTAAAPLFPSS
jgi:DNA repair ATPase RecN